mmetsp:Transcript_15261/g.41197  ORF Transcript_15261/g.41197 Transcript_15261/m.41197 type:complete len:233 (+) Transcript_15261:1386-2084(+)
MTIMEPLSNSLSNMIVPATPRMEAHISIFVREPCIAGTVSDPHDHAVSTPATLPNEYMTPFGKPVEPEVLKMMLVSSGDTQGGSTGASSPSTIILFNSLSPARKAGKRITRCSPPPASGNGAYWGWSHTTSLGSYKETMEWMSCTRRSVAKGMNVTPSFKQLRSKTANSGRFSAIVTILSPACKPKLIRLRTKRLESASKFLKVKRSSGPTPSKTIASKSPYLSTASAHRRA